MADARDAIDGLGAAWERLRAEAKRVYPPICTICGKEIDLDAPPRSKWSWSLNHLDPRATHGNATPTIDRVAPAHNACNSSWRSLPNPSPRPQSRDW